jgi:hypothetical protein
MSKKVVVVDCDDCQYYETHSENGVVKGQFCYKLNADIHKNITMDFPENCPLENN